ncbi:NAD(P)/FAD-dependent oxidoreductase [Chondromyces crocatus]
MLVERDTPPQQPAPRAGAPQSRHCHLLLLRGQQLMNDMFPGLAAELCARGAEPIDWIDDIAMFWHGRWVPRFPSGMLGHCSSRDLLELVLRERIQRIPSVTFVSGHEVTGLVQEARQIRGVCVRARDGGRSDILDAPFVVDASGRSSRAPHWLQLLGHDAPEETRVDSRAGYASRLYEPPPDASHDWRVLVVRALSPSSRGGGIYPMEGRWLVTLTGYADEAPEATERGFDEFLRALPDPAIGDALRGARPLSPVCGYRGTATQRRHYERLRRAPDGFVTVGDAFCAFNPVYAQGMALSVLAAQALDRGLMTQRLRGDSLTGFAARFHRELAKITHGPWLMAIGEDFRYPTTQGPRPPASVRLAQRYMNLLMAGMGDDPALLRDMMEVMHMLKPPQALFTPTILARTLLPAAKRAAGVALGAG